MYRVQGKLWLKVIRPFGPLKALHLARGHCGMAQSMREERREALS